MYIYISIGRSPTIDNICGLPSDISIGPSPTIDILSFRQPSEPSSLDSSHALTPKILGCPVHVECMYAISITVYNTCKYINMHIFT